MTQKVKTWISVHLIKIKQTFDMLSVLKGKRSRHQLKRNSRLKVIERKIMAKLKKFAGYVIILMESWWNFIATIYQTQCANIFFLLLILSNVYAYNQLWRENFSYIRHCSIYLRTFFTCPFFLTMMHTALPSLLRALPEFKKKKKN